MKNVNKQRRNFISLSELGYEPQGNNFRGFAYICQSKWVGIIAIKTERTQIHFLFLSDVLVAVAPLDLKVPLTMTRWYRDDFKMCESTIPRPLIRRDGDSVTDSVLIVFNGR